MAKFISNSMPMKDSPGKMNGGGNMANHMNNISRIAKQTMTDIHSKTMPQTPTKGK